VAGTMGAPRPLAATGGGVMLNPAQAQVQYDMLQLHRQRMMMHQWQRARPVQGYSRFNRYGAFGHGTYGRCGYGGYGGYGARYGSPYYHDGGVAEALAIAMLWDSMHAHHCGYYGYGGYGGYGYGGYGGFGFGHHHGWGHHHYHSETTIYRDAFNDTSIDVPPDDFNPDVVIPDLDGLDDPGDGEAFNYGAGGEEPPLPDGGGAAPRPAGPVPVPPSRSAWLPPVSFRSPRRPLGPLLPATTLPMFPETGEALPSPATEAAAALRNAEEEALGSWLGTMHKDLAYRKERDILGTSVSAHLCSSEGVCLVTQCSVDRLSRLRDQCLSWAPGVCSVAVFLQPADSRTEAIAALAEINSACCLLGGCLVATLVHAVPEPKLPYDGLYPVNALRNVAMDESPSDLVFLLDVDFLCSRGLQEQLLTCPGGLRNYLKSQRSDSRVLVVPAFELKVQDESASRGLPEDFATLQSCKDTVLPFHVEHFPAGHRATNFSRWTRLVQHSHSERPWAFDVNYEEFFEPYIVFDRTQAPRFDERFRGYGLNKCSFSRHCHSLGFKFAVLVEGAHFVVAKEHPRSSSWRHVYGSGADPAEALRLGLIWRLFLRGLPDAELSSTGSDKTDCSSRSSGHRSSRKQPPPALLCRAAAAAVRRSTNGALPLATAVF